MKAPQLMVKLDDIPPEGLNLILNVAPGPLAAMVATESEDPPRILSPLTGTLRLTRTKSRLAIKGDFEALVEIPCDRCLNVAAAPLKAEVNEKLDLINPGDNQETGPDEDLDGGLKLQNGQVNLAGLLAELFWLAWPFRFICRPDCAGICPRCGADLNDGPCGCSKTARAARD